MTAFFHFTLFFNFCARFGWLFGPPPPPPPPSIWYTTDLCDLCSTKGGKGTETKEVTTELFVGHLTQLLQILYT